MPSEHKDRIRAVLLGIQTPSDQEIDVQRSLKELTLLARDLGYDVEHTFIQKRNDRESSAYFGAGKLKDIADITGGPGDIDHGPDADDFEGAGDFVAIVDDELAPGQLRNLEKALGCTIIDRVAIILRVFELRARTTEAKLQVELARLDYELPRIKDDHSLGDREGGGGRASRGASNVELAKQRIRKRMAVLKREIEARINTARKSDDFQVSLVGYTNAGKSALTQALTRSEIYVEDKLFATLGISKRQLIPPSAPPVMIADTVGFLDRLPHGLIASFRSTLAEAGEAWLILHVIDASDPHWKTHWRVTDELLKELELGDRPIWRVFNKVDLLTDDMRAALKAAWPEARFVSALNPEDVKRLRQDIVDFQSRQLDEASFALTYEQYQLISTFRKELQIVTEDFSDDVKLTLRAPPATIARLKQAIAAMGT